MRILGSHWAAICPTMMALVVMFTGCSSSLITAERFVGDRLPSDDQRTRDGIIYGLPKGLVEITIERKPAENGMQETTLNTGEPIYFADPDYLFLLNATHAANSSDKINITISETGLLSTVETTAQDAIPLIVERISDEVATIARQGIVASAAGDERSGPFLVRAFIDPSDPDDQGTVDLRTFLYYYGVELEIVRPTLRNYEHGNEAVIAQCDRTLCFRAVLPYLVRISDTGYRMQSAGSGSAPFGRTLQKLVMLPNKGPIAGVELRRRALVTNTANITFTNGMLTNLDVDNPSVGLALASIPIDVAKAIFSIPSALFQFRVTSDTKQAELEREKTIINAQTELAKARLQLIEAEKSLSESTTPSQN